MQRERFEKPVKPRARPRTLIDNYVRAGMSDEDRKKMERRYELTPEQVNDAIRRCGGVFIDVAADLGVRRMWLYKFITDRKSCCAVWADTREAMGDTAEKKLFELINKGHFQAIVFYLSTMHEQRGWALPKGQALPGETNNFHIGQVNVMAVPAGKFLTKEDIEAQLQDDPIKTVDLSPSEYQEAAE